MVKLAAIVPATNAGLCRNITNKNTVAINNIIAKIGTTDKCSQLCIVDKGLTYAPVELLSEKKIEIVVNKLSLCNE